MPASPMSPTVPYGADETLFVVLDNSGVPGAGQRQVERADLDTVIADLMSGQFNDPEQIVAYNTLEHWTEDLSADVANEIVARCDSEASSLPAHLEDFVRRHARRRELAHQAGRLSKSVQPA